MKKTLYQIGMLAAAALAFVACNKETEVNQNTGEKHYATISLSKGEDTKTMVDESGSVATYKWNDDDAQYIHVYENGTAGTVESFDLNTEETVATLTVSFTGTPTAPYSYEAKYANTLSGSKNPQILSEQSPLNSSFDPAADVLVSKTISSADTRLSEFNFTMGRPATVNKMTLTGLVADEVISKVEFTLDKAFVGGYVSYNNDNASYQYNSNSKKLTLNYNATTGVVPANGEFPVYFVCAPVDAAPIISVVVTTDQNVYIKSTSCTPNPFDGKSITFELGKMKRFTMAMSGYGEAISTGVNYNLVSSQSDFVSGAKYLIVGDGAKAMSYQDSNNRKTVDVVPTSGVITIDNSIDAYVFQIDYDSTNEVYTIKDVTPETDHFGDYLHAPGTKTSGNNYLRSGNSGNTTWNISIANGVASITNATNSTVGVMCLNGSIITCYASQGSYKALALYIDPTSAVPTLGTPEHLTATDAGNGTVNVSWDAVTDADSYTVTLGETSKTGVTTNSTSFNSVADGTYTVTVTAISNDHTVANDSEAASTTVKVGTPALGKPVIDSFTETSTGFSAEIDEAIQYATSYDWDLYVGSVDYANWIGNGNTTDLSFDVAFADTDITEFTTGETYLLVVTAKADGYASTESDPSEFVAVGPSYDFTTVAELNGLLTTTATEYVGYLTDAVVSFTPAQTNAFVTDGTGSVMFYKSTGDGGHGLLQGQTFTGAIRVTACIYKTTYNNLVYPLYSEVTAWDATFTGSETTVNPESVSLADLAGNYSNYQNAYVSVAGLTVESASTSNNKTTVNVTDGTNTYVVYDNTGSTTCGVGDIITAVGTVTKFRDSEQIKVWKSDDITITAVAPKAITFSQPASGGTFTVTAGGSTINSGDTVVSGTTVTLTATPANDYTFNGWTVSGATVTDASAATTTFEMGTSSVSISASFTSNSGGGDKAWTLVTDASTLSAGDVIVFAAYNVTYKASGINYTDNKVMGAISNSLGTPIDVTFSSDGTSIPELPSGAQQYTLGGSVGAWTIMNGSKYLTKGSNKVTEETTSYTWTISISSNNAIVTSVAENTFKLQYNPNSGNGRFATYSSSQKAIRIYRYE